MIYLTFFLTTKVWHPRDLWSPASRLVPSDRGEETSLRIISVYYLTLRLYSWPHTGSTCRILWIPDLFLNKIKDFFHAPTRVGHMCRNTLLFNMDSIITFSHTSQENGCRNSFKTILVFFESLFVTVRVQLKLREEFGLNRLKLRPSLNALSRRTL